MEDKMSYSQLYPGQIVSLLQSGNLQDSDTISGPYMCIVGTASSGPCYRLRRVINIEQARDLFENGGSLDTPLLRDISIALRENSSLNLYVMRIGGRKGTKTFTQDSGGTLEITPGYEDAEVFEKYEIAFAESQNTTNGQRILIYDVDLETVVYDSDGIIVPDLGLFRVRFSSDWDGYYEFGIDGNGNPLFASNDPLAAATLDAIADADLTSTAHNGSENITISTEAASDGSNLSKPEMYACLNRAYRSIQSRYMDYIVPSGVFFDDPSVTNTVDYSDHSVATSSGLSLLNGGTARTINNIDWSGGVPTAGDSDNDALGFAWQYKFKNRIYTFMTHAQETANCGPDLFTNSVSGSAYINQDSASVVSTELEVLDLDLQALLNTLHSAIANTAADSDAVGAALDSFDTTNTATYGALFTGHGIDNSAYPTPADGRNAAYALINAIRPKVGLDITLADRVKYLTFVDAAGDRYKVKNLKIVLKQSLTDEDGASLTTGTAELGDLEATVWDSSTGLLTVQVLFNSTEAAAVPGTSVAVGDVTLGIIKAALESSAFIDSVAYTAAAAQAGVTYVDGDLVFPQVGSGGSDVDTNSGELSVGKFWLTHKELMGDDIPAKVWTKFLAGNDGQFREINFGHQLASFCYEKSTSYHMALGFISFREPSASSGNGYDVDNYPNYIGEPPEYQGWGGKLSNIAIKTNGDGVLGHKLLSGAKGYRYGRLNNGTAGTGLAYGGLICTKGLSLPNKTPYGINDGDEKVDGQKQPVDIGRHIVVSAAWPSVYMPLEDTSRRSPISALLGAKLYSTPVNLEPFGEINGAISQNVTLGPVEIDHIDGGLAADMKNSRITLIDEDAQTRVNFIRNLSTAAHWNDDFKRISTIRCVNRVVNGLRNLAKQFIGRSFTATSIASLQTTINGYLKSEKDVGVHQGASATLSFSRADRINGNLKIRLKIIPPFAIETIEITTSVAADESEL